MLHYVGNEVWAIPFDFCALANSVEYHVVVVELLSDQRLWNDEREDWSGRGDAFQCADEGDYLPCFRQDFEPWAVFTLIQGIKWFAKGEICYDVKSDIVKPIDKVEDLAAMTDVMVEILDKLVDVRLNDGLLLME